MICREYITVKVVLDGFDGEEGREDERERMQDKESRIRELKSQEAMSYNSAKEIIEQRLLAEENAELELLRKLFKPNHD